jgi:hypothetical protein
VSAAALAVGAGRGETAFGMDETMIATLVVYWLAHVYTATVRERRPGSGTPLYGLLRHSGRAAAGSPVRRSRPLRRPGKGRPWPAPAWSLRGSR